MRKKALKTSLIIFFLVFTSYNFSKNNGKSILFSIKEIDLEGSYLLADKPILQKLEKIRGTNLLLLNKDDLLFLKNQFDLISDFKVKKIYPDTIKIKVIEKKPIAILIDGKKKSIMTEEGEELAHNENLELKKLPFVFGKNKDFFNLFKILNNLNFDTKKIQGYYYFEIGRWDLKLDNKKIIKLPVNDYDVSIKEFIKIQDDKNFEQYKIFDYRIKNQLILN